MATYFPAPISLADIERQKKINNTSVPYSVTDWWDGFKEENLPMQLYQYMTDNSNHPPEENYNPSQDPQLQGYDEFMHHFYFSKSQAETRDLIEKLKKRHQVNKESPWYHLGRITGAFTDPSMLLLLPKVPQVLKTATVFGTAATAEEFAKQNTDPFREDAYVAWVAGAAYGIPFILNKLSTPPTLNVQKNIKNLENEWIGKNIKDGDIGVDGTFVPANQKELQPSGVGAEGVSKPVRTTVKKEMTGEKFIETNLKIFGEDGPWTPVFRVIKQKTSLTARRMMGDLLDTPLLKLKNTKAWGFSATGKSIETDMRMMRVGEIESHKMVKDQYTKYVQRQQLETGASVPRTDIGMMFKNRKTEGWYSLDEFSKEVTIARLKGTHDIPEVAEAARITSEKVYKPLFNQVNELKIREIPVIAEIKFFESELKRLRKQGQGSVTYKSKYGDPDEVYALSRIEATIDKLTKRLKRIQEGKGVKNYINIVYVKNAIDKNPELFREIIEDFFIRTGRTINKADLDRLVKDLSNHFPFIKPRKGDYDSVQRYVFKDPRYARSIRSRELNLDTEAQLKLIDAGFILSDIFALQKIYSRQVIPDILLTKKYGDPNGLGFRFIEDGEMSGFFPGLMSVANEYNLKATMGSGTTFYRGTGKKKVVFEASNAKAAEKGDWDAAFGPGIYLTKRRGTAKRYGDKISEHTINVKKTYTLKDDYDIAELFKKAGVKDSDLIVIGKKDPNNLPKPADYSKKVKEELKAKGFTKDTDYQIKFEKPAWKQARAWLEKNGYDSVAIAMKTDSMTAALKNQKLRKRFDHDQTIVFDAKKVKEGAALDKNQVIKERDQILGDLEAAIELIKGTYGLPANPHAWTSVAMRTMKHYNALTMLTGFMAAIPDVARITMTSGIKRGFRTQFELLGDFLGDGKLFKMGKKEAQSFGEAVDMVTGQRAMLFADVGDMFGLANKFEGGMGKLSAINFMYINLMSRWTEMAKSMASVTIGSRIIEDSILWGKGTLGDKWKTALASSGIDKEMARRIAVQFEKYGTKTKHNFMANTSQWDDVAAVDAFGAALNKDINITIVTPGLGDTPKWMSTELGSTLAQFKKFAMSSTQRMLMRGMQERDLDFLFGAMMLMGSGMLIDGIYHKTRFNRDYGKLSLTQKIMNAFDRSGLAGIYTDVNKAIETLTDNRFGLSPLLGEKRPYGSSMRWKMGTAFGASGGQIYNIFDIMYDVTGGKYNHHTAKNVRRLIPFQNVWYLDWLFDDIQKGLH